MPDSQTTLIGNVTRDPEMKFTASGRALVNIGLAVSRRWQQNNEWKEETSFFDVTAWAGLAENAAASIEKGNRIIVVGRLEQQRWEQEGSSRSKVVVIADAIGPDLRFATAEVTRIEREGASPTPRPAPAKQEQAPAQWDEEPF